MDFSISELKKLYDDGQNIMATLKKRQRTHHNSPAMIQVSYDLQAGSYIRHAKKHPQFHKAWSNTLAATLDSLKLPNQPLSLLEAGVGEATTLAPLLNKIRHPISQAFGFDISWSRVKCGQEYIKTKNVSIPTNLFMADIFNIPLPNDAVDVVYTSHSLEPNGGKEKEALQELYRVARHYVVLLEPAFEFATKEARERMRKNGYIRHLPQAIKSLGYSLIEHRLYDLTSNPLNPTGLYVIKKTPLKRRPILNPHFICPVSGTPMERIKNCYYSSKSMLAYPILDTVPCLMDKHAIIATQFKTKV